MSANYGPIGDLELSEVERALVGRFVERLRKKTKLQVKLAQFEFAEVFAGLSQTKRLRMRATGTHQYFLKIGEVDAIAEEFGYYNFASARIESNRVAHLEPITPIFDKQSKADSTHGLIAYSFLDGDTFFDAYPSLSPYELMEAVDLLFSRTLRTFHNFPDVRVHRAFTPPQARLPDSFEGLLAAMDASDYLAMAESYSAICEGLPDGIYPNGPVHGDLHLGNIIMLPGRDSLLIDFGMLREETCQLRDFAEFEIALICCAISHEPALAGLIDHRLYGQADPIRIAGTSKLARGLHAVRGNLLDSLHLDRKFSSSDNRGAYRYDGVCTVYSVLLMGYALAYFLVSDRMFGPQKAVSVRTALRRIFGMISTQLMGLRMDVNVAPRGTPMRAAETG